MAHDSWLCKGPLVASALPLEVGRLGVEAVAWAALAQGDGAAAVLGCPVVQQHILSTRPGERSRGEGVKGRG